MSDLFRTEALEHQQQQLVGTIILRQAWSAQVAAAVLGGLIFFVLVIACTFGFARRETLPGRWLPEGGLIHSNTLQPGLVEAVRVVEGQAVRSGDVLFELSSEREGARGSTSRRVDTALAEQRELLGEQLASTRSQAALTRDAAARKLGHLRQQLRELREAMELQTRRGRMSEEAYQRFASAAHAGAVSHHEAEEKHADAIEQAMRLKTMRREEAGLQAEVSSLGAELDSLPLRTHRELAAIRGRLSGVRQTEAENDTRHRWEVKAPRTGRVTVLNVEPGQSVTPGEALASIAPEGVAVEAVLYAPSRAAGLLKAGMPATLRFDALPYQKYGQFAGTVRHVSRSPVPSGELPNAATSSMSTMAPMYRVRVSVDTKQFPVPLSGALKPGMELEGTVTLEHRRFVEWAVEPLLAAKERL